MKTLKILIMKLFFLFTVVMLMSSYANVNSQIISYSGTNLKMSSFFKAIKKQVDYDIISKTSDIHEFRLTVHYENENLDKVLTEVFKPLGLTYVIDNKAIVVRKALKPQSNSLHLNKASVNAQVQSLLKGKVLDAAGLPLAGVSVAIKNKTETSQTDQSGLFTIAGEYGDELIFRSVGYKMLTHKVSSNQHVVVKLEAEILDVEEVVVVGYGTVKKENLTGSVSSVNFSEQLGDRPVNTIGTVLQGAAAGLQVTQTTGEPGGGFSMNIRGTTSINGGSPLILVDNVPFDGGLNLLNPADIESVSVLKDAASASIYGARSAYGVILITTKKGKTNVPVNITYHNNLTINTTPFLPVKATPIQTVKAYKDAGAVTYYSGQQIDTWLKLLESYNANPSAYPLGFLVENGTRYQLAQTDEMGDMLDNVGKQINHNISVRGGGENSSYGISLGTTNEKGILVTDKDKFNRYNVRAFINTDIKPWLSTSLDMLYNNSNRSMPNGGAWFQSATGPSYNPIDTINVNGEALMSGTGANFIRLGESNVSKLSNLRTTGKIVITPIKQVRLNGEYTFDKINGLFDNYTKRIRYANSAKFGEEFSRNSSEYIKYNETTNYKAINIYGDYSADFGSHGLKVLAGFNQEERYYERQYSSITQMINDDLPSLSQGVGEPTTNDSYDEYAIRGFFGRINYNYLGRYLLELNGRYDGSSKFPPNHRWGFFPSVSIGWRIIDETFMSSLKPYISELKLRGSYGTVGNQAISTYAFVPGMSAFKSTWLDNNTQPRTLNAPSLVSNRFTWETVESENIGLDFGFLAERLTGSIDIYSRRTKNMLAAGAELPAVLGTSAPLQNVADLQTKGFELEIGWKDKKKDFRYGVTANLFNYKAEITKFNNQGGLLSQYYVGSRMGDIWGYVFDRYYQESDFVEGTLSANKTNGTLKEGIPKLDGINPNPGDILFKDLDDNNVINVGNSTLSNPGDRRIIGNSNLGYQYGVRGDFSYKGISLSINLQGVMKRDRYLNNDLTNAYNYEFGTIYQHQLNYWAEGNSSPDYPRLYIAGARNNNHTSNYRSSTYTLMDASYLRLQNLTLGYSFKTSVLERLKINDLRFFASSENLYTWSKLPKGIDPATDAKSNGLGYPYMRSFSFGLNINL